ncbi:NACHT domain-containing protein [Streptomyces sp. NPDC001840]
MPAEIIAAAAGVLGKIVAKPAADAALRRETVLRALKAVHLDPKYPPRDFDSLYAYTLIEYCAPRPAPVLTFFRDAYVLDGFRRSFASGDWSRLREEAAVAIERNMETREFGHLGHGFEEQVDGFVASFQALVDRSRAPHETRLENKVDELLIQVEKARLAEEQHRTRAEPRRTRSTPAERLMSDVREWFDAVGYTTRETWSPDDTCVATLVDVPQRRGRYDRNVMLCVEGELSPHHMRLLREAVDEREAAEGWGIARLRVSESARRRASDSTLFCYTFDELIDLEADFDPYIAWVEAEVAGRDIDTRYVPLSCRKEEVDPDTGERLDTSVYDWRDGGLDRYVEGWLREPDRKHLSILGEFGMGKSWFGLHLAGEMARGWRDAKKQGLPRPRVPLVIPLREYAKQTSVEALLSEFFFHKHSIDLRSYEVFRVLNRMGRLLLIFDGFDEMAARSDRNTMVANFWQLANAVEPGAKVLLSSRTEHFPHAREARDVLGAQLSTTASSIARGGPSFDIVELVPFDDEQITRMLGHLMDPDQITLVMSNYDVRDLMRRPVMSELVMDALPEIQDGAQVDLARIYLYAIRRKLDRDIEHERTFTSRADKLYFLCEVAWEMLSSDRLALNYREFPDHLRRCFGAMVTSQKDLDYWEYDMRNQGMLVRNSEGDYGPAHKSLLEFLVAYKFAAELGVLGDDFLSLLRERDGTDGGERTWSDHFSERLAGQELPVLARFRAEAVDQLARTVGAMAMGDVVFDFLVEMASEDLDTSHSVLYDVISSTADSEVEVGMVGGNCANLLVALDGDLEGAQLRNIDLHGFTPAKFWLRASFIEADLRGAHLEGANLADVDLSFADLRGASLAGDTLMCCDQVVSQLVAHPGGAITVRGWQKVFHWPDGQIENEPHVLVLPDEGDDWESGRTGHIFSWGENDWAYANDAVAAVVSSESGRTLMDLPPFAVTSVSWAGQTGVLVHREWHPEARIVDPKSGGTIAELRIHGQVEKGGFGLHPEGLSAWSIGDGYLSIHLFTPTSPQGELQQRHRLPSTRTHISQDTAVMWAHDNEGTALVVDLFTGRVLDLTDIPAEMNYNELYEAAVCESQGTVYFSGSEGLTIFDLRAEGGAASWTLPSTLGLAGVHYARDRGVVLTGTPAGEVAIRDPRTGYVLSSTSVNSNLRGARFSNRCGLPPLVLDSIQLAGGILSD